MGSVKKTSNASSDSDSNGRYHRGLASSSSHSKFRPPHKTKCKRRRSSRSSSSSSSERGSPPRRRPRSSAGRKQERSSNRSRRRSSSSSSSSDSSDSSTSDDERRRIAKKKRAKKKRKKAEKKLKKQRKREARIAKSAAAAAEDVAECDDDLEIGPPLPDSGVGQAMKPMTKEEWDKQRNEMRRVIDPETGRSRLIRGRGEILEEAVSQRRHQQINKQATQNDGANFQKEIAKRLVK